jgi:acetyltransferase-like isoleucine patch superfamily enzyme
MDISAKTIWTSGTEALRAHWYLRGADVARTVRLTGKPFVVNEGTMIVRDRVRLISNVATLELATGPDGTLDIGERSYVNYGCSLSARRLVKIGADCNIGTHCIMMDNDFHRLEPERRLEEPESKPIVLEDNVWLGGRVIVLAGVTIGADSVIGAGSVVTRDVPPKVVAAGVPARVIRGL